MLPSMKVALAFLAAVAGLASAGVGAAKPRVLKVTSPVAAGTTASASISVQRGARCSIEVRIAGAVLGGRGLGSKRAQTRRIVWTWRVPPGAAPGRWPITVDCGAAGAARTSFVVVCPSGFVASRASCRPAPDLRVAVAGTPAANRVGGRFSFRIEVLNVGKAAAPDVVLTAEASAELVAVGAEGGSCVPSGPVPGVRCDVGRLAAGARTTATLELRATTLGALSVSARAASSTPDARPADNAAAASTGVTPPDSVSGSGVRPSFGSALVIAYVELDAISGSGGDDAAGRFTTRYASSGFARHVTWP